MRLCVAGTILARKLFILWTLSILGEGWSHNLSDGPYSDCDSENLFWLLQTRPRLSLYKEQCYSVIIYNINGYRSDSGDSCVMCYWLEPDWTLTYLIADIVYNDCNAAISYFSRASRKLPRTWCKMDIPTFVLDSKLGKCWFFFWLNTAVDFPVFKMQYVLELWTSRTLT